MRRAFILLAAASLTIVGASSPAATTKAQAAPTQKLILTPASPNTIFTFEGLYPHKKGVCDFKQLKPLRAKYRGKLELIRASDGHIRVIDSLTFSNYLRGLAEVPNSWPEEALKAQAIAARSYALANLRPKSSAYDICSTDQCQVYRGAAIELGAFGERWVAAVEGTRGKILTYNGSVIPSYFFSTSEGRTKRSFPGGTPQPWLPSVSGEDSDAPLATWTARVNLSDLAAVLRISGAWPGGSITSVSRSGDTITVSGSGHSITIGASSLRIDLNNEGPCLFPKRYPSQTGSSLHGPLPQTIPSEHFTLSQSNGVAVFSGRGWGHGIGMSQYGARHMADTGSSATQILKHFYGPAQITTRKEPGQIRVLAAEGLTLARIAIDGPVRITTETGSELAPGTRFEVRGGSDLSIRRGIGPSLKPILEIDPTTRSYRVDEGGTVTLAFTNSRSARVVVELAGSAGLISKSNETSFVSGPNTVTVKMVDANGARLTAGSYTATITGYDGLDHVRSVPVAITVAGSSLPPVSAPPAKGGSVLPWILVAMGVVAVAGGALWVRRGRAIRT